MWVNPSLGTIYVFDKGYVNYQVWQEWSEQGAFYVTRLNNNAQYKVLSGQLNHISQYANGGVISDQVIELTSPEATLKARLIVFNLELYFTRYLKGQITASTIFEICVAVRSSSASEFSIPKVLFSDVISSLIEAPTLTVDKNFIYYHRKTSGTHKIMMRYRNS